MGLRRLIIVFVLAMISSGSMARADTNNYVLRVLPGFTWYHGYYYGEYGSGYVSGTFVDHFPSAKIEALFSSRKKAGQFGIGSQIHFDSKPISSLYLTWNPRIVRKKKFHGVWISSLVACRKSL